MSQTLIEIRRAKGWTQAEAAARAGTTQATLSRLEGGGSASLRLLLRVIRALDASPVEAAAIIAEVASASNRRQLAPAERDAVRGAA